MYYLRPVNWAEAPIVSMDTLKSFYLLIFVYS